MELVSSGTQCDLMSACRVVLDSNGVATPAVRDRLLDSCGRCWRSQPSRYEARALQWQDCTALQHCKTRQDSSRRKVKQQRSIRS